MKLKFDASVCIAKIAAIGKVTPEQAKAILQEIADFGEKKANKGQPSPFNAAAKELGENVVKEAQAQSEAAIRNAGKRARNLSRVTIEKPEDAAHHTRAILVNENGADKNNIANFSSALFRDWGNVLKSELRKAGLLDYARSEGALSDISTEMWNIRKGELRQSGEKNPARETARIIIKSMEAVRGRLNAEGADITKAIDYVFHTSHDPEKMRYGGRGRPGTPEFEEAFNQWWKDTRPLLDDDKTFGEVVPRGEETQEQANERFGKAAFTAIYTGVHESEDRIYGSSFFGGSPSLTRRLAEGRVFFFKDGASWAQYVKTYGRQLNALELAMDTIKSGSDSAGALHFLGDNPKASADMLVQQVTKWLKDNHPDLVQKYRNDLQQDITALRPGWDNLLHQVGVIPTSPVTGLKYRIYDRALKLTNIASLGFVAGTHAASLSSTFYLAGKALDMNSFQIMGGLAKAMVPHSVDQVAALSEIGAYFDGVRVTNPYDNGGTVPGFISSAHDLFMTATGIRYLMRHAKAGFIEMVSNHLVNNAVKTFEELGSKLRQTLSTFGITAQKWDIIRSTEPVKGPGGRNYLMPHSILENQAIPEALRQETSDQLMMFYSRMADLSTVTPGPREAALLHGQGRGADLTSLFTQFAAWPLAAQHQLMAKTYYEAQSKSKAMWTLGVAVGLSALAGYMRITIRDMAAGKPPEAPKNPADLVFMGLRSAAAGGVGGILGDYLVGSIGQLVGNSRPMGGPVIGDVATLAGIALKLAHSAASDQKYNPWPDLAHFAQGITPAANLFYLKGAMDYLVFYHLFEAAQPGWWQRTNLARIRRGEGTMAGYFPGAPIPYNPLTPEMGLLKFLPHEQSPQPGLTPGVIGVRG